MTMDTSFVSKEAVKHTHDLLVKYGKGNEGLAFNEADKDCGYPESTMASYFGKLGAKKKEEKKRLEIMQKMHQRKIDRCNEIYQR